MLIAVHLYLFAKLINTSYYFKVVSVYWKKSVDLSSMHIYHTLDMFQMLMIYAYQFILFLLSYFLLQSIIFAIFDIVKNLPFPIPIQLRIKDKTFFFSVVFLREKKWIYELSFNCTKTGNIFKDTFIDAVTKFR